MITAWWIFVAFALGGCAGVLLIALLRSAADQDSGALFAAQCESCGRRDKPGSLTNLY
jgi:hypothetical protein